LPGRDALMLHETGVAVVLPPGTSWWLIGGFVLMLLAIGTYRFLRYKDGP
jgi:hypothetical protein